MHKRRPGLRFGQKLNSGGPRALDRSKLVGTIEDSGHDEAYRFPTSTKPDRSQRPSLWVLWVGPPPINLENRPQVDTSFSRPVWPQFCFYPLRGITQRTQSDGRWLRSGFVEVGDRSASSCPESSMVPTSLLRSRALGAPEFSF